MHKHHLRVGDAAVRYLKKQAPRNFVSGALRPPSPLPPPTPLCPRRATACVYLITIERSCTVKAALPAGALAADVRAG